MGEREDVPRRDPLRPFRVAMYGFYLAVVGTFSLLIIVSVVKSVIAMTPGHRRQSDVVLSERECFQKAEQLWNELEKERQALASHTPATTADDVWAEFRVKWLERHRQAASMCALDSRARARLREVFLRLDKAMDLYTTHAVQYSGEVGPTADALKQALNDATK